MLRNVKASPFNGDIGMARDWALDGDTLYFPAAEYPINVGGEDSILFNARKSLKLMGDGHDKSILKRLGTTNRWATFKGCRDIHVEGLGFDRGGQTDYGGWAFYNALGVTHQHCRWFDSDPPQTPAHDLYPLLFALGSTMHKYVLVEYCIFEDLQLEVDFSDQVLIQQCKVYRSKTTASIGGFTQGRGYRNYEVCYNTIFDPIKSPKSGVAAFVFGLDPPTDKNCVVENINVHHNRIVCNPATPVLPRMVQIGTGNLAQPTTGNAFKNFTLDSNRIENSRDQVNLYCNNGPLTGFLVDGLKVRRNILIGNGAAKAIDLRYFKNGDIRDNMLVGTFASPPVTYSERGGSTIPNNGLAANIPAVLLDEMLNAPAGASS